MSAQKLAEYQRAKLVRDEALELYGENDKRFDRAQCRVDAYAHYAFYDDLDVQEGDVLDEVPVSAPKSKAKKRRRAKRK